MELDEEDSHLCIRCNQTIIGLQNYVNHRQSSCGAASSSSAAQSAKPSSKPSFSSNFDFLHPAKKMENFVDFGFDERDDLGIDERNNKSTDSEQYDYDFFSSLELQCMSKRGLPPGLHQSGGKRMTRKATAAIMSQNGDEWIDETKKTDDFKYFGQNESDSDEESEESEPEVPANYTRGKWKPGSRPPNNFTGGKWKPESDPSSKVPAWDDESSIDEALDKSLDDSHPPPGHTRGKWVPGTKITKLEKAESFWCSFCSRNLATRAIHERHLKSNLHLKRTRQENDLEEAAESLPLTNLNELSTHFKKELADRAATSTPLADNPVNNDIDDDEALTSAKSDKKKFRSRSKVTCEVCDMKLPVHLLGNHLISHFHYRKMLQNPKKSFDVVLDNFHKIIIQSPFQCHPCKFYFNTQDEFMRHWNSIAHVELVEAARGGKFLCSLCKFESVANDDMTRHLNGPEHQQVVALINRSKPVVVRLLSMLKCENCALEFRYNVQLLEHLKTCRGAKSAKKFQFDRNSSCDLCSKSFQSALSLQKHKRKVHKRSVFFCSKCEATFATADEAKMHRSSTEHKAAANRRRMAKDPQLKARLRRVCPICKEEQCDVRELRSHILEAHPEHRYSCGRCGMKFPLAQEVSRHVRDKVCKFYSTTVPSLPTATVTSEAAVSSEFTEILPKVPENSTGQVLELDENFGEILSPTTFASVDSAFGMIIDDEIAGEEHIIEVAFSCKLCDFSTESHAELLYHETLHRLPLDHEPREKIECQVCHKFFSRPSLRQHLRQHTNERIFECPIENCPVSFTRKANLRNHVARVHRDGSAPPNVCPICGKKFQTKYILEQHKFVHRNRIETKTFPCQLPNCIYTGRSSSDTRHHLRTHSDERLFACTQLGCDYRGQTMEQLRSHSRCHLELEFRFSCERCDYKAKLPGHIKRHSRIHDKEDGKIYKCPYCEYACNNVENLRKHVLKTSKHPGKFMYECDCCEEDSTRFKSNLLKEYMVHLQIAHGITKASA